MLQKAVQNYDFFLVPVYLAGGVHGGGEDEEDAEAADEEGVTFELHDYVDEEIEHGQKSAHGQGCTPVLSRARMKRVMRAMVMTEAMR